MRRARHLRVSLPSYYSWHKTAHQDSGSSGPSIRPPCAPATMGHLDINRTPGNRCVFTASLVGKLGSDDSSLLAARVVAVADRAKACGC